MGRIAGHRLAAKASLWHPSSPAAKAPGARGENDEQDAPAARRNRPTNGGRSDLPKLGILVTIMAARSPVARALEHATVSWQAQPVVGGSEGAWDAW